MQFQDMNLNPQLITTLAENKIISPTEIQEKSIPQCLQNPRTHIIGQAKTGSGKTLAFAIPITEHLNPDNHHVQAVIMVPTRELCKQVSGVFNSIIKYKNLKIVEIYGGVSIKRQIDKIRGGAQIVVATPGRLIDLYRQRQIGFKYVKFVALDEADRMLDMGFLPDIRYILLDAMQQASPQLMLFSATLLADIRKMVKDFAHSGEVIELDVSEDEMTVGNCEQYYYYLSGNKFWNLVRVLEHEKPEYSIIFTKTKRKAQEISKRLSKESQLGLKISYISGDLSQAAREDIVAKFRKRKINCLIGTNVLARGLDFDRITHVFNYDLPVNPQVYVHRIGRTARVSGIKKITEAGKAISLVTGSDRQQLRQIEKFTNSKIQEKFIPGIQRKEHSKSDEFRNFKEKPKNHRQKSRNRKSKSSIIRAPYKKENKKYQGHSNKNFNRYSEKTGEKSSPITNTGHDSHDFKKSSHGNFRKQSPSKDRDYKKSEKKHGYTKKSKKPEFHRPKPHHGSPITKDHTTTQKSSSSEHQVPIRKNHKKKPYPYLNRRSNRTPSQNS